MAKDKLPICPRCESDTTSVLTTSPVKGVWEVYHCGTCLFAWRSIEPDYITDPKKYDQRFKLDPDEFDTMDVTPPVAELAKS